MWGVERWGEMMWGGAPAIPLLSPVGAIVLALGLLMAGILLKRKRAALLMLLALSVPHGGITGQAHATPITIPSAPANGNQFSATGIEGPSEAGVLRPFTTTAIHNHNAESTRGAHR